MTSFLLYQLYQAILFWIRLSLYSDWHGVWAVFIIIIFIIVIASVVVIIIIIIIIVVVPIIIIVIILIIIIIINFCHCNEGYIYEETSRGIGV